MSAKKRKQSARHKERVYIPYEKTTKGPSWLVILIFFVIPPIWPIGAILLLKKLHAIWKEKKLADYRNYAAVIGDRCEVDVRELSAKLGKTASLVYSDLQVMIDKGYLGGNAYLDRSRGVLILDAMETEFVEEEPAWEPEPEPVRPEQERAEPEPEPQPEPEKRVQPEPRWSEDAFEEKLRQIRALNDEIEDEEVSRRIDRIGELTASIFRVLREKPEREDEVKKFMNYYLPTTFKLLKSYALMEKQSYQGENIVASRKKIENILDSLITAFEQQQDRLFQTEALDVEADIQVLETMMAKDGLVTPKGLDLRAMGEK